MPTFSTWFEIVFIWFACAYIVLAIIRMHLQCKTFKAIAHSESVLRATDSLAGFETSMTTNVPLSDVPTPR